MISGIRGAGAVPSALALSLLLASGCVARGPSGGGSAGSEGSQAAAFALPDLEGNTVRLADFRGRVVVLNFWATWCPPCRAEVPDFVHLQSKYREQGLSIVGLSLDASGAHAVRPFAEEHDVNYTMLIANDQASRDYGGIVALPTTFVVDRKGRIVKRFFGRPDPEVFEEIIRPLLEVAA